MPIYKDNGKRNGLQKYRVRVNYTDVLGTPRQMTRIAYGLEAAKQLEIQLSLEVQNGSKYSYLTIGELYEQYTAAKAVNVRETSLDKTKRILKRYVLPSMKDVRLSSLSQNRIQLWKSDLAKQDLKIITMQNIFGEFRAMLNFAVRLEYIPKNPLIIAGNFRDAYFTTPTDRMHYYTPEQFTLYNEAARRLAEKDGGWGYYVFFNIAFYTGMRKGEINALRWTDIEGNIIHVRRSVAQKIKGRPLIETPPKNKSSYRDLQIPKPLMTILEEHKERQKKDRRFRNDYRVCGGMDCLRDSSITNRNFQYADAAGLPHIRIHDFRHTHASLLANAGVNIQEIARRLGHSDIKMTWDVYSHLYPKEEEKAVAILNEIG